MILLLGVAKFASYGILLVSFWAPELSSGLKNTLTSGKGLRNIYTQVEHCAEQFDLSQSSAQQ